MFLLIYSTIKIRDTTTSSTSSSAMERSFEKLSMLPSKTSVSAGHSALQNAGRKEKIRLWSTLFSSSTSKNDTCDREEDFAAIWRKKLGKEKFLAWRRHAWIILLLEKRLVYRKMKLLVPTRISAPKIRQGFQYKSSHLSTLESSIPASDTSITSSTTSTLQARRRMVPELLRCQKGFWTWTTTR